MNTFSIAVTVHSCDVKEQTRCEGADKEYTETNGVETESDKLSLGIWEANKILTAYTMHACSVDSQTRCSGTNCGDNGPDRFKGLCDNNGCAL